MRSKPPSADAEAPKFLRVKRALQERIARGDYPPESLLPSEKELMREFEGSRQTVIRALNELRAEGVIRRKQGKGSFVHGAKSLRNQIGILTYVDKTRPSISAYPQNLLRSLMHRLHQLGEHPQIFNTFGTSFIGDIHQHGREVLDQCARGRIRCLIVENSYNAAEVEVALAPWSVHVVGSHQEKAMSRFNFGLDAASVGETGFRHLLEHGFRKIAYMEGRAARVTVQKQVQVYMRLMEESQMAIRPGWIRVNEAPTPKSGYQEFGRLWEMNDRPDALLIGDDIMAQGATRAMIELGVNIPHDLTVMVETNRWSGMVYPVPIIALEMDPDTVGAAGADLAYRLVRGEPPEAAHAWVKPHLRIFEVADPATEPKAVGHVATKEIAATA